MRGRSMLAACFALACSNEDGTPAHRAPDAGGSAAPLACGTDEFAQTRIAVGELELNVACQGRGRTAVLLHGYPEFHAAWRDLAGRLSRAGYRVVAPDQRGFNTSDRPDVEEAYHIDHLANDVVGLIERVTSEPVLLVSHDWGGVVAWVVAHRRPDLLRGLVVMNGPHPDAWMRPEVDPVQAEASARYVPLVANGTLGPSVIEALLAPFLTPAELETYRQSWAIPGALLSMRSWYSANVYPTNELPTGITVTLPTLLLWGMADPFVTPSELETIRRLASDLRVTQLPGVGHWVPHEAPEAVAQGVLAFDAELR